MKVWLLTCLLALILSVGGVLAACMLPKAPKELQDSQVSNCTLSGTYSSSKGLESCSSIVISSLTVPTGVTLDLTAVKSGAIITFTGTTTFDTKLWEGPLVLLSGSSLTVTGSGTLDGQGEWYWKQAKSFTRPVFIRLSHVDTSVVSGLTIQNSPFRTFSIVHSTNTTLTGLTLDASAGDGLAKNTDGFDLSYNDGITISNNTIKNQDDCLAMQSSVRTVFSNNTCSGGHGISIGSIGGPTRNDSNTVQDLTVENNHILNSVNGLRIKTIVGMQGVVSGVLYQDNSLTNVTYAIVVHSDYSKSQGGYTAKPTSDVVIQNITITGLSGTATNMFDVLANPSVVSNWTWSDITVSATSPGVCDGQPSGVPCA